MTTPPRESNGLAPRGRKLIWTVSTSALILSLVALALSQCSLIPSTSANPTVTACPTPTAGPAGAAGADGLSAYELWQTVGNTGSVKDFLDSLVGEPGPAGDNGVARYVGNDGQSGPAGESGDSAYQLWLDAGNVGTTDEFLESLIGQAGADGVDGDEGPSAYDLWIASGHEGSESVFLASLIGEAGTDGDQGADGLSAYEIWVSNGGDGDETYFLSTLVGAQGAAGATGANGECVVGPQGEQGTAGAAGPQGLPGVNGSNGLSAYDLWVLNGGVGDTSDFLAELIGDTGATGATGATGPAGPEGSLVGADAMSYIVGGGTLDFSSTTAVQPTFSGQPQFYGNYVELGDLVFFTIRVDMSNITYFGRGQYFVTLPFTTRFPFSTRSGRVIDENASHDHALNGIAQAGTNQLILTYDSGSSQSEFDYNSPVTLSTGAEFFISGSFVKQ